ncbi:MAG: cytochrome ubiquinol oxidase subunit I [Vulcanisaeta sp.]
MSLGLFLFSVLGFTLIMHLIFVNVIIGAAVLTVSVRYLAYLRNDNYLEFLARRMFRILVIFDLFGGVWGTILTVYMGGFFPSMTAIFTKVYYYPVAVALTGILLSIPLIVMYWHLWGRISPRNHSLLGILLAASILLVPIGFRYLFAGLNYPVGIMGGTDAVNPLLNPIYPPLIIHTILGGIDIGAFVIAAILATKSNLDVRGIRISLSVGVALLVPQAIAGAYYYVTLTEFDPYIANNISGPLLGARPELSFIYPLFYVAIILVAVLAILGTTALYQADKGIISRPIVITTGILSEVILVLMEFVNDGSRYPYLFMNGYSGTTINQLLNTVMPLPLYAIYGMIASTIAFTIIFSVVFYYGIIKHYLPETEE